MSDAAQSKKLALARARMKLLEMEVGQPATTTATEPESTAAEAALQGVGQGLSFGFLPWLQSKAEAIGSGENPFGDKAEIYRQQWAQRGQKLASENPNISLASEIAGGMLLPIGAAGTGAKAAAKMGAGLGALSGLGRSASSGSDLMGSAENVLTDAAFGGLAGGAMGKLGAKLAASRPSEAVARAAAAAPGAAEGLREIARHQAARAALRPYFTDSKELVEQAARSVADQTEIPVEKAFSEAGEYLIQNKMVPGLFSNANKTAKELGARSEAAGQLMGGALDKGDEFLQAWGIQGVPLSSVTGELAGKAAAMRSQLGKSNQTAALESALENVESVANFDRPRTLRELQRGATSAYGDVKFAKPDLSKEPKLAEAIAYKNAIRNVLGGMGEPGFREKLSQATYPAPRQGQAGAAVERMSASPVGQSITPVPASRAVVQGAAGYLPAPAQAGEAPAAMASQFREISPLEWERLYERPKLASVNDPRDWRFLEENRARPVGNISTDPDAQRAAFRADIEARAAADKAAQDAQAEAARAAQETKTYADEFVAGMAGRPALPAGPAPRQARLLPGEAAPEARWNDVSNLLSQYNIGAKEFGINRSLRDIASKGEQRRWALRMLTPKASGGALAGGVVGGLAGGIPGALMGAGLGGTVTRGIQLAADPLTVRASLAGEKALKAFPSYAPAIGSALDTSAQAMGTQTERAGQFAGGALSQYFGMGDQPVQASTEEEAQADLVQRMRVKGGQP